MCFYVKYFMVWTVFELLMGKGGLKRAVALHGHGWIFVTLLGHGWCEEGSALWSLGSPSGQWIRVVADEAHERFKCKLMDEVEDRTTDCVAFA